MYSRLRLGLAKTISDNYYDKLITNIAKEMYINNNKVLGKFDPELKIDLMVRVDVDKKISELAYEEVLKGFYSNIVNNKSNDFVNKTIKNKLIQNEEYKVLNDILFQKDFFSSKNNDNSSLYYYLTKEVFPSYNLNYGLHNNRKYFDLNDSNSILLEKILEFGNNNDIKKQYINKAINTIFNIGDYRIQMNIENSNGSKSEKEFIEMSKISFINNIKLIFDNNKLVDKNDLINNMYQVIDFINENKMNSSKYLFLAMLDYCEIDNFKQYELLCKNFDKGDYIFKSFLNDMNNQDMFFEETTFLKSNDSKKIELNLIYDNNDIKLINELIGDIKQENNISNKEIMISKLKEKFKINDDSISLENINNVFIFNEKNIKQLSKDEFENLCSMSENIKIKNFEEKLNSFEDR